MTKYEIAAFRGIRYISYCCRFLLWAVTILIGIQIHHMFGIALLWSILIAAVLAVIADIICESRADDFLAKLNRAQYESKQTN